MLGDVMDMYQLPKEAWVDLIFKRYLHLPDDIVNLFITSLPAEQASAPMESMKEVPSQRALMESCDRCLSTAAGRVKIFELRRLVRKFYNLHESPSLEKKASGWKREKIIWTPASFIREKDVCMSPVIKKGDVGHAVASIERSQEALSESGSGKVVLNHKVKLVESNNGSRVTLPTETPSSEEPAYRRYLDLQDAK
jgi:hypothetical protein